jgi:hypothetical protein
MRQNREDLRALRLFRLPYDTALRLFRTVDTVIRSLTNMGSTCLVHSGVSYLGVRYLGMCHRGVCYNVGGRAQRRYENVAFLFFFVYAMTSALRLLTLVFLEGCRYGGYSHVYGAFKPLLRRLGLLRRRRRTQ